MDVLQEFVWNELLINILLETNWYFHLLSFSGMVKEKFIYKCNAAMVRTTGFESFSIFILDC